MTAEAELDTIPSAVIQQHQGPPSGTGTPGASSDGSPEYRPAEGQAAKAYRVSAAPTATDIEPYGVDESSVGMDTTLGLQVGGKRSAIPEVDDGSSSGAYGSETPDAEQGLTFACTSSGSSWSSAAEYPCAGPTPTEFILVVTHAADSPAQLSASVNAENQFLDLATGDRQSDVSSVNYSRDKRSTTGGQMDPGSITTEAEYSDLTCDETGLDVSAVELSGFSPVQGWAPKDKAWLTVHGSQDLELSCYWAEWNLENSSVLTIDGNDASPVAVQSGLFVFEVPDSFTAGQFGWRPRGKGDSLGSDGQDVSAPERATLDVSIPE